MSCPLRSCFGPGHAPAQSGRRGSVSRGPGGGVDRRAIGMETADTARPEEQCDGAIEIASDLDGRLDEVAAQRARLDLQPELLEEDGVVVADDTVLLAAEDLAERAAGPGHEGAAGLARLDGEALIVRRQVGLGDEPVGRLDGVDAGVGELLGQAALEGAEHALRAPACLGRIGGDMADAELSERPPDLGGPFLGYFLAGFGRVKVVAAPVGVERAEQPVPLEAEAQAAAAKEGVRYFV